MPRNGAGVFNLAQPAFQSQTPISSTAVNLDLSDIADGLTASLPRDGQAGMTAVLPLASTGFSYLADPNTGMRRTAADTQAIYCGGIDVVTVTTTGVDLLSLTVGGNPILPTGTVLPFSIGSAPNGFILCDGSAVSRTTYANLFNVISTSFGSGDGATTFNIPDLRGRVVAGVDPGGGRLPGFSSAGAANGFASQFINQINLPNVSVSVSVSGSVSGTLNSTVSDILRNSGSISGAQLQGGGGAFAPVSNNSSYVNSSVSSSGSMSGGMSGGTVGLGSGTPFPNVQPTMSLYYIIKT